MVWIWIILQPYFDLWEIHIHIFYIMEIIGLYKWLNNFWANHKSNTARRDRQYNCPKHAPHAFEPKHTDTLPLKWNACKDSLLSLSCLYWSAKHISLRWTPDPSSRHKMINDEGPCPPSPFCQWTPNTCGSARGSDWHETHAVS